MTCSNDPACYAAAYCVLAETDLADRLPEITAETLVMTGEHDRGSNPRMARLMHERTKGSILRILPVLRHSILVKAAAGLSSGRWPVYAAGSAVAQLIGVWKTPALCATVRLN